MGAPGLKTIRLNTEVCHLTFLLFQRFVRSKMRFYILNWGVWAIMSHHSLRVDVAGGN